MQTNLHAQSSPRPTGDSLGTVFGQVSPIDRFLVLIIVLAMAAQFHLALGQKINWDEFYFLSMVHDYGRGELSSALQTFHVHLFGWLPASGLQEVGQIISARVVMWLCELGTGFFVYSTLRAFLTRTAALFAVLSYVGAGPILIHGASFRADPLAAFLVMYCLWVLARSDLSGRAFAGLIVAAALACMVTIKVVFFAPVFAGLALWRTLEEEHPGPMVLKLSLCAIGVVALSGGLYAVQLGIMPMTDVQGSKALMSRAYNDGLMSAGFFPRVDVVLPGMLSALPQSILLVAGLILAVATATRRGPLRRTAIIVLVMAMPLLSFLVYRNAFPYFFAFISPPAMGLVGFAIERVKGRTFLFYGLGLIMSAGTATHYVDRLSQGYSVQRQTINAVHEIFPQSTAYIDRCSMISSFPKVGFFMSGWGIQNYRNAGIPVYEQILSEKVVPLLILNSPYLKGAVNEASDETRALQLLPEDIQVLRRNYIPHWGPIYVAGKSITAEPRPKSFTVEIPGLYTVEAVTTVLIDGVSVAPRSALNLERGRHTLEASNTVEVTLRWGDNLLQPVDTPPQAPLFTGF